MLGFHYNWATPTTYVMQFRQGQVVREGAGLSFFYFAPWSTVAHVPLSSTDAPFVFNEMTRDYQEVTLQGQLTYRIKQPAHIAQTLDFSVDRQGRYRSDDPEKIADRLIHSAQILTRSFCQQRQMTDVLVATDMLVEALFEGLAKAKAVQMLGVEVLDLAVIAIQPAPEMAKALQAEAREALLKKSDEAVFARRNAAIEMERQIKENELNTEIAVQQKERQVRETKLQADIAVEQQRTALVDQQVDNQRKESAARSEALRAVLLPLKEVDWRTLLAASNNASDPSTMIAWAFRDLADGADRIGQLNISPDLLQTLLHAPGDDSANAKEKNSSRHRRDREE